MKNILNKRNMIKIASLSLLTLITVSFTACGGGGDDASFTNSENLVDITIPCQTTPTTTDIANYITVNSGDVIVKEEDNTTISIYHDINGTKKVCLVSGSAHIIKQ
jgi:hypothetical protein